VIIPFTLSVAVVTQRAASFFCDLHNLLWSVGIFDLYEPVRTLSPAVATDDHMERMVFFSMAFTTDYKKTSNDIDDGADD
jgi:hypothetical protein